jgi:glucose/arabinose dehydrogenase
MKYNFTRSICCFIFFICLLSASAQPNLNYSSRLTGLDFPVDLVGAPDGNGHFLIVQQDGIIKYYNGTTTSTFLDLSGVVTFADERGLLSMAFHPHFDGALNRYFFVYYTTTTASVTTVRIVRYQTQLGNPLVGDPSTANQVIAIAKPSGQTNHNGGKLNFGIDGMLYFATGDGGSGNDPFNNAQDGTTLLGKMLRLDINGTALGFYSIPADNPYVGNTDGVREEIWALGLRNPFRWSFDPVTNAIWIGDVGQGAAEEVDVRLPSPTTGNVNYGWRCYEGNIQPPSGITACSPLPTNYVAPIFTYGHNSSTGGFAITGGYVYRGADFPLLYGYYVFADYVSGNVWTMTTGGAVNQQVTDLPGVSGFGEDENGELFALSRGTSAGAGALFRINSNLFPAPVTLVSFTVRNISSYNELHWSTAYEQNADKYVIEYSTDGSNYAIAGEVTAMNSLSGYNYTYRHAIADTRKIFYRLKMRDLDGSSRYSSVITIGGKNSGVTIYPTIVQNNMLELNANVPVESLRVFDTGGKEMYGSNLNGRQGYFSIQLPTMAKGMYFVTIQSKDYNKTEKIIVQ